MLQPMMAAFFGPIGLTDKVYRLALITTGQCMQGQKLLQMLPLLKGQHSASLAQGTLMLQRGQQGLPNKL